MTRKYVTSRVEQIVISRSSVGHRKTAARLATIGASMRDPFSLG
jgi:hypothetical protein